MRRSKTGALRAASDQRTSGPSGASPVHQAIITDPTIETLSGNGALKYSHLDEKLLTEFGIVGDFKQPRPYRAVAQSMRALWEVNPRQAVQFALYLRLVTRRVKLHIPGLPEGLGSSTQAVQRGQGLKHEGMLRFYWLGVHQPETFKRNIGLLVLAGSWRDVFQLLRFDLIQHGWEGRALDWAFIGEFITVALGDDQVSHLVRKYMPSLHSSVSKKPKNARVNHAIASWLAHVFFGEISPGDEGRARRYKAYRTLKASGRAHVWQQQISRGEHARICFDAIPGIALSRLLNTRYLTNQGLDERYMSWLDTQSKLKFNGYPHELFEQFRGRMRSLLPFQRDTINKQFEGLVASARDLRAQDTGLIVVRDTSYSMSAQANGSQSSCDKIAKAIALFFSSLMPEGRFANSWIEFSDEAKLHMWEGDTVVERWNNDRSHAIGSTNFQSVIKLFCDLKRALQIPDEHFPKGIVCISDGEFNPADLRKTNVEVARESLKAAGFSERYAADFKIVLWNLQSSYYGAGTGCKFETHSADVENVFYFSGYSPSVVLFLTGLEVPEAPQEKREPKTMRELVEVALSQELLELVTV